MNIMQRLNNKEEPWKHKVDESTRITNYKISCHHFRKIVNTPDKLTVFVKSLIRVKGSGREQSADKKTVGYLP